MRPNFATPQVADMHPPQKPCGVGVRSGMASEGLKCPSWGGSVPARHGAVAGVQHGLRAPVLRPAGDVVTDRHRSLLAVGDGTDTRAVDAVLRQEVADRGGTAGTQRNVVFARAALVGMAFDGNRVLRILLKPLGLLLQGSRRLWA